MSRIRVGVLRGGPSSEYEVSLKSGAAVLKNLKEDEYHSQDIFITKDGIWHYGGVPSKPEHIFKKVDVIFNALHGEYGEDGKVQHLLEIHKVPYTGSDAFSSALGMNKVLSKKVFLQHGIKTPIYKVFKKNDVSDEVISHLFKTFPIPAVVKPVQAGSSVGVTVARTLRELVQAFDLAFSIGDAVLVEEYISGREATCGVVEHWRNEPLHALIPIEIRPKASPYFDYNSKYVDGGYEYACPGNFTEDEKRNLEQLAKQAHKVLGLRHYSRSDFILHPRRGIYILEVNTLPGLTETSLVPKSVQAGGSNLPHFLDHLIKLALKKLPH